MTYSPIKIIDETLKVYINRTAEKHNDLIYKDFRRLRSYHDQNPKALTLNGMAKLFGVNYRTMKHWFEIDDTEQRDTMSL